MKLTSIHLQNYRAHKDLRVKFHDGFNIITGINGSGKTSLLKGVCEALKGLFWGTFTIGHSTPFNEKEYAHVQITNKNGRYRFEQQLPVSIQTTGVAFSKEYVWIFKKGNTLVNIDISGNMPVQGFKEAQESSATEESSEQDLPIIAFYRADRQWLSTESQILIAATEKMSRLDGYKQWENSASGVSDLQHWVIAKCLERFQHSSDTGKLFNEIDDDELALVNVALSDAIENISGLRYDMQQKSLLVDWRQAEGDERKTISFDHLSDGQRAVICLVADIARRICLLNPQLGKDVIRKTPGVVLIDELDVHLHPRWQRRIVNGLKAAFPCVQFIATSHSPQVLGELQPEEIILLRKGGTSQPQVSYGLDSSQVLEEIMGASARNLEVEAKLKQLFVEIESNRLAVAKDLLDQLKESAPQIPELGRADALIRRKEVIGR